MDAELEELFERLQDHAKDEGVIDSKKFDAIMKLLKSKQEALLVTTIQRILSGLKNTLIYIEREPDKALVFDMVAELAKSDEVRDFFVDAGWIALALDHLENEDDNIVLHALRSIGNICFNNDLGRKALLGANGAHDIVNKLQRLNQNYDPSHDNRMDVVTCGCVLNLATDDPEVSLEMVSCGAMPSLLGLARQSISSNPVLCRMAVSAISVIINSVEGKASFVENGGPGVLIEILRQGTDDEELSYVTLEVLSPLVIIDDDIKVEVARSGGAASLTQVVADCRAQYDTDESKKYRLETAADMIVTILTENVCMRLLFENGEGVVLKECINWLSSRNRHLEISGALALGNFGRSDENCIRLVEIGAHKYLLNHINVAQQRPDPFKHLQAVFGALKNLALPVPNKSVLVRDGCLEACLNMLKSQSPIILAKVLGTMCAMMMAPSDIANRIMNMKGQLEVLVRLSKTSNEDVKMEACRLLALLVKQGQSTEISNKMIMAGGLSSIIEVISSPKNVVQNEALIAMTVMASTVKAEFYPKLRETGLMHQLIKLIRENRLSVQACYNSMAYLEALSLREYFVRDLQVAGISRLLEDLMHHQDENIRKRALIMLTSIKARQLQEDL
ncbi:rap1 GTPase-GDP dissociation stimulator 1 isoform X2 [Nematostella vectensis]|uniref:rap1 GTPase-GDP dissociation stimulator 1 isoform X2 n=1 Tax=Nematostella vectensis TaxID=45351 RepID=UPI00138FF670|nr:rap1 GTPase-GDP dissociation stimulator 1 isoform X2 [Nematostella vectensis]